MISPTPGELLAGVHRELRDQVLPQLPSAAARQVRAALHTIDQVARTWDRQHAYIAEDNADLEHTLDRLARLCFLPRSVDRPADPSGASIADGVSDPALLQALLRNVELQQELDDLQNARRGASDHHEVDHQLAALHHRMARRAAFAAGVNP